MEKVSNSKKFVSNDLFEVCTSLEGRVDRVHLGDTFDTGRQKKIDTYLEKLAIDS